ncbi:MAG: MerR family transcriptional regulator [Desulfobulbaceae bacterium]|uniref:MerR family transcriptional regulator n=1 Tax=Candidatus Desulfobia pelagia TaxID=2841692 RepID=A0A8J6NFM3_9BACT|nr:MerR family transcriptional regulator [Candidatus Desulfobia pelagia]
MKDIINVISGEILDEDIIVSVKELCRMCKINHEIVIEMIEEGIIAPKRNEKIHWQFQGVEIKRIQIALRLKRDLHINTPGVALVLDLLDEIENLRSQK